MDLLVLIPESTRKAGGGDPHAKPADEFAGALPAKVREAKQDWVGYVIVIGDKETAASAIQTTYKVYDRDSDQDRDLPIGDIIRETGERGRGMPYRPLYFPAELSKRPVG